MRRILKLVTVAVVMAALVVVMASPALSAPGNGNSCNSKAKEKSQKIAQQCPLP